MSGADPARAGLDAQVLDWLREERALAERGERTAPDEARFEALALALFAFQFERCPPYRRFCEGRGRTPENVEGWQRIPCVPTGAFKELRLASFPAARTCKVFRTSGTATRARGELHLDTLRLYEESLLPVFRRSLLPDLAPGARARILVLAPSPDEAPDSSLSHMFGVALRELGDADSGFLVEGGELDPGAARRALARESPGPLLLCGAAFAFVHLLEALEGEDADLRLPAHARVMETGGFKGRARERTREELYGEIEARLGVPPSRVVNQYGMTELASQFYDTLLADPEAPRHKRPPPWTRVRLVDPLHPAGSAAAPGEAGAIQVFDLANTGSLLAIQTADLGRAVAAGFEVLGREPGAEARGCSIALDELLGGERG